MAAAAFCADRRGFDGEMSTVARTAVLTLLAVGLIAAFMWLAEASWPRY
jgi:hypothetical protein